MIEVKHSVVANGTGDCAVELSAKFSNMTDAVIFSEKLAALCRASSQPRTTLIAKWPSLLSTARITGASNV